MDLYPSFTSATGTDTHGIYPSWLDLFFDVPEATPDTPPLVFLSITKPKVSLIISLPKISIKRIVPKVSVESIKVRLIKLESE